MSLTKNEIILVVLGAAVLITIGVYQYLYQSHDGVEDLELSYTGDTNGLLDSLNQGNNAVLWTNKAVQLADEITGIDSATIQLNHTTFCQLNEVPSDYKVHDKIVLIGRFIGYDELMEEVKLDQCEIVK